MAKVNALLESEVVFVEKSTDKRFQDLTGGRFSRLVVIGYAGMGVNDNSTWFARCDCGNIVKVFGNNLKRGLTHSCGCYKAEQIKISNKTHGCSGKKNYSRAYHVWAGIRQRCMNPNCKAFKNYGGRGINVCERWQVFENFLADMGECPDKEHSLDRIDNNGNYEPGNCRWTTWRVQQNNRRNNRMLTFNGKTQTLTEWNRELGFYRSLIPSRLKHGWTLEKTMTTPSRLDKFR